jgi:hypothetical protein
MTRIVLALLAVVVLVCTTAGCGGSAHTSSSTTSTRTLMDLRSIGQLRRAFNSASGEPRLIVLVSPT